MSYNEFVEERSERIKSQGDNQLLSEYSSLWFREANSAKYSYNFEWLGRPIIQYPQDIVQFQETVFAVKPDLIVETGIAHGGSLVLSASLLCLLDLMEGLDPKESPRKVLGIDIDIRKHNKVLIENHPLAFKIKTIEGSSIDPSVVEQVREVASTFSNVLISLDSNHTHDHVYSELNAYGGLVSINSYIIVYDTVIDSLPNESWPDRSWHCGNSPNSALQLWLKTNPGFQIDNSIDNKLLLSVAPAGFVKRVF